MPGSQRGSASVARQYVLAAVAVIITVTMVVDPETAFEAALNGLHVWFEVVFPALLPFFIGGHVLMGLGVVRFMGVLMEPMMRPLFNVPGSGSFVVAMGLASGYPIGAVLTSRMRREGLVTKTEAERLVSFSNTADPLFMAGAVAVGMFNNPSVGGLIMAAHYLGAIVTGFVLRFYGPAGDRTPAEPDSGGFVLGRALRALIEARRRDGRSFGQLLGESVRTSVDTLLLIGGFIIVFSVIIQMLRQAGIVGVMAAALAWPLGHLGVDPATLPGLVSGVFEITIGTQAVAQADAAQLQRVMMAGAVIAWSGLSVLGQVAALIQGTDIALFPYVVARVFHALAAAAITVLLYNPGDHAALTVTAAEPGMAAASAAASAPLDWVDRLLFSTEMLAVALAVLGVASLLRVVLSRRS